MNDWDKIKDFHFDRWLAKNIRTCDYILRALEMIMILLIGILIGISIK